MTCPNCGKDDIYTRDVTHREEEFDHYDDNGNPVYRTVWVTYYEHTCQDCGASWPP